MLKVNKLRGNSCAVLLFLLVVIFVTN